MRIFTSTKKNRGIARRLCEQTAALFALPVGRFHEKLLVLTPVGVVRSVLRLRILKHICYGWTSIVEGWRY